MVLLQLMNKAFLLNVKLDYDEEEFIEGFAENKYQQETLFLKLYVILNILKDETLEVSCP